MSHTILTPAHCKLNPSPKRWRSIIHHHSHHSHTLPKKENRKHPISPLLFADRPEMSGIWSEFLLLYMMSSLHPSYPHPLYLVYIIGNPFSDDMCNALLALTYHYNLILMMSINGMEEINV